MISRKISISRSGLLSFAFLAQLWAPLIIGGSPTVGGLIWVSVSLVLFLIPAAILLRHELPSGVVEFGLFIFVVPSILIGISNILNEKADVRSTVEIWRIIYFFIPFLIGCLAAQNDGLMRQFYRKVTIISFVTVFVYTVTSILFSDMVDDFEMFYGKFDNVVSLRTFAPFANPYDLALFMVFPVFYFMYSSNYILSFLATLMIFATQSRTGIVISMAGILFSLLISTDIRKKSLIFVAICSVFTVFILSSVVSWENIRSLYIIANTEGLIDGGSTTISKRISQWSQLNFIPVMGVGSIASEDIIIENGVLYELYRLGVFGVYNIITLYIIPAMLALLSLVYKKDDTFLSSLSMFILLVFVGSWSNVFIYQPKMSLVYWMLVGTLYAKFLPLGYREKPRLSMLDRCEYP